MPSNRDCVRSRNMGALTVVCLLALFVGCNEEDIQTCGEQQQATQAWTPSSGIVIDFTEDNFCFELARAACATIHECCPVPRMWSTYAQAAEEYYLVSEESCRHFKQVDCEDYYWLGLYGMKAGTVDLDVEQAGKCLESVLRRERECTVVGEAIAPEEVCEASLLFHGMQGEGKPCVGALECQPGLACAGGKACVKLPAKGKPCVLDEPDGVLRCGPDLYCEADGTCRGALSEGEECQETWQKCLEGLFCAPGEGSSSGRCEKKRKSGEPCRGDRYCSSGFCQPGWCLMPWGLPPSTCHDDSECYDGICEMSGAGCSSNYECSEVCPEDGEGQCVPEECVRTCLGPMVCVDASVKSGQRKLCDDARGLATVQPDSLGDWFD